MMKKVAPRSLLLALALTLPLAAPGVALAQDTPPPSPPAPEHTRVAPGAGLGIGAIGFLSGPTGAQVVYDMAKFHVEGMFGFNHDESSDTTAYVFGARGWYHLHSGSNSDFSLGGGLGMARASGPMDSSLMATFIEPGALARVFLTSNVAVHGTVGFRLVFGDDAAGDGDIGLDGQVLSAFGFTYFFR